MASLWSSSRSAPEAPPPPDVPKTDDVADAVIADVGPDPSVQRSGPSRNPPPSRPPLLRNTSRSPPAPTAQNAQPAQPQQQTTPSGLGGGPQQQQQQQQLQQQLQQQQQMTVQQATDSLSLMQLRRMVAEIRQVDPVAYDFEYTDMGPHGEEIDEWFGYLLWQRVRLNGIQRTFEWQWQEEYQPESDDGEGLGWSEVSKGLRTRFVNDAVAQIDGGEPAERTAGVAKVVYLVLGRWGDTAAPVPDGGMKCAASEAQLEAIDDGVRMLAEAGGLEVVWRALRLKFDLFS